MKESGSQQESQKLTGDSARETPRTREQPGVVIISRVTSTAYGQVVEVIESDLKLLQEFASEVERELNAKSRELEEARKDAERYRYIRDAGLRDYAVLCETPGNIYLKYGDAFDAAIDSALHHDGK